MGDILNQEDSKSIKVQKYQFGKLELDDSNDAIFDSNIFKDIPDDSQESVAKDDNKTEKDDKQNDLLEKIELLTSEIVTLQMELEKQTKKHSQELETKTKEAYEKAREETIKELNETMQSEHEELKSQLIRSITLLQEQKENIDKMFENIEEELVDSALLIAKKVIKKELETNSAKVAKSIASALIETLKSVGKLTLKVNPNDFTEISEHFNSDSITIEIDEAISRGGIIILSDTTNIDATISTRLDKAMELIGKE